MPRLTMRFVESLTFDPEKGKIQYYRDDQLQGFGLMVRQSSMTYFAEKRVKGAGKRVMIGQHPLWSPEKARNDAMAILGNMAKGLDPVKTKDIKKTVALTLGQAFEEFMAPKEYRPLTRYNYPRLMNKKLGDWLNKPVTSITRDMVEERFRELSSGTEIGTSGKADANLTMTILRSVLNFASLKHEVDGEPLLSRNPVSRLTQAKAWHRLPRREGTT